MIYDFIDTIQMNEKIEIFEKIFSQLQNLFSVIDFDEFQRVIIKQTMELVDSERALLFVRKESTGELMSKDAFDTRARAILMPEDNNSIAGYCVRTGLIVNLDNIDEFGKICNCPFKFNPYYDKIYNFKTRNVVSVPIIFKDKTVGVLQALNKKEGNFLKRDEILLEKYTYMIAGILEWRQQIEDLRTLETLEREKAQFIRVLVHELKSPASAIVGLLNMALQPEEQLPPGKKNEYIARSRVRAEGLIKTIQDLLVLHDIKGQTEQPAFEPIDPREVVDHLVGEYKDALTAKNMKLIYKVEGDNFQVRGSKVMLPLVFSNLISNAIKYSPENSKVEITLTGKKKYLYFTVRDYGIGIPEKDQKNIFKEFHRAKNAKKLQIEGTGLGLVAVRQIVDMHFGKIYFKSRENEGTWFMIRLPLASEFVVVY